MQFAIFVIGVRLCTHQTEGGRTAVNPGDGAEREMPNEESKKPSDNFGPSAPISGEIIVCIDRGEERLERERYANLRRNTGRMKRNGERRKRRRRKRELERRGSRHNGRRKN